MSLNCFSITPARLTGLMTLSEQDFLKQAASQNDLAFQMFPSASAIAGKMKELLICQNPNTLSERLSLLQLFAEIFGEKLKQTVPVQDNRDARERLRAFLMTAPADMLAETSFKELAQIARCTPRHLSRIFFDLMGVSFSDKRAEIRLAKARELLATSKFKVVEVAFESGYKSLSLFNQMFTRRFGISPGKWRQKNGLNRIGGNRRNGNSRLLFPKNSALPSNPPFLRTGA
jgi:AraC-like DNA-binding protein